MIARHSSRVLTLFTHIGLCAALLAGGGCAGIPQNSADTPSYNWYHDWTPVGVPYRVLDDSPIKPLSEEVRQRAGSDARNCSRPGIIWEAALACVFQARAEGATAYVAFGNYGVDSLLGWGIASLANGGLELYRYDSSPCGGGNCPYALGSATCKRVADPPRDGEKVGRMCLDPLF